MSGSPQITNREAFEQGSLVVQIVLTIVTLGLYSIYWWYNTATQLSEGTDADLSPGIVLIALFIPFGYFYSAWKVSGAAEAVTDQSRTILMVFFVLFAPISWYLIQSGINEVAQG